MVRLTPEEHVNKSYEAISQSCHGQRTSPMGHHSSALVATCTYVQCIVMSRGKLKRAVKLNACTENTFSLQDRRCVYTIIIRELLVSY